MRIPLSVPVLAGNELAYLTECIESTMVSSVGPFVTRLEVEFAAAVRMPYAVSTASGSAALHVGLHAVGVGPGDEVWIPDSTFIATANAVAQCGASVVLVDSEPETGNVDPDLVASELRRRADHGQLPAAIVPVHLYGHPADLSWVSLAREMGVRVIEDAAEALGAEWTGTEHAGLSVGAAGDLGCFSFNGNKIITSGNGGMVVGSDQALLDAIRHLTTQAKVPGSDYEHDAVGFNYRLSNVSAALGVAQLEQLPDFVESRRSIAAEYERRLADVAGVRTMAESEWAHRSAWLSCVTFKSKATRDAVRESLTGAGIESRPWWTPMHRQIPYCTAKRIGTGGVADQLADTGLCLPSTQGLGADVELVVETLTRALGG